MTSSAASAATVLERRRPTRPALVPVATTRSADRATASHARRTRRRLSPIAVAVAFVVASLLAVVGGNMLLDSGQLRLEQVQSQLADVSSTYAASQEEAAALASPAYVAHAASLEGLQSATPLPLPLDTALGVRLPGQRTSSAPCCTLTPGT